jgi:hypothetical protein
MVDPDYITAGAEQTAPHELIRLARSAAGIVRRRVAENPRTPLIALIKLAYDRDPDVRIGICDNSSTPPGLLMLLAGNNCVDVRYAIAENSKTPCQILRLLSRDENPYVADRAMRTLDRQKSHEQICAA